MPIELTATEQCAGFAGRAARFARRPDRRSRIASTAATRKEHQHDSLTDRDLSTPSPTC